MTQGNQNTRQPGPALVLTTLGGAALSFTDETGSSTQVLGAGKPLALFIYLACSPARTANREHLTGLLWADSEPQAARHNLAQTVFSLRQRLGDDTVSSENGDLVLQVSVRSDRDTFLEAVDAVDLEEAVRLYAGDFLPEFAVPGAAEFEHWAYLERDRLRMTFVRTAETVVRRRLAAGRAREAQPLARRVRDIYPGREAPWRLLLECLVSGNDTVAAAIEADALEHLLRESNREPEPSTRTLLKVIREPESRASGDDGSHEDDSGPNLVAELVGREREFSVVVGAWEKVIRGRGVHVHIDGTAGIGKTRLLNDLYARLRGQGAPVARVRAHPGERTVSYALAAEIAEAVGALPGAVGISPAAASSLVALNPVLSSRFNAPIDHATGQEALRRRTIALTDLMGAVAEEKPFALLIDDLHWSDADSRRLLGGVLERRKSTRCLVVTAARSVPEGSLTTADTEVVSLKPLTTREVAALTDSIASLPPHEPWAARLPEALHDSTGGSPLLVIETLQLSLERGSLLREDGVWACPDPSRLERELEAGAALRYRIETLSRAEWWLLLLLSTAGVPLRGAQLARMTDGTSETVTDSLSVLERRGLAGRVDERWMPAHDEIALRALETAKPDAVKKASARIGAVLAEESRNDPELIPVAVRHLVAVSDEPRLQAAFAAWVRYARSRKDNRSHAVLARELLGDAASPGLEARMLSQLPIHVRLGSTSARRVAMAAAALVAGLGILGTWAVVRATSPAPDGALLVLDKASRGARVPYIVPIRRDDWERDVPIRVEEDGKPIRDLQIPGQIQEVAARPDGKAWVISLVSPDSGGFDLYLVDENGVRRLTDAPADDVRPEFSPDGRLVAFNTGRWNPRSWNDIALLDLATGDVRPLATGDSVFDAPYWSPDGSRIAYQTHIGETMSGAPCWITVDGRISQCLPLPAPFERPVIVDWLDENNLILRADSAGRTGLAIFNLRTGRIESTAMPPVENFGMVVLSPDSRWVALNTWGTDRTRTEWMVFPWSNPEDARPLSLPETNWADPLIIWNGAPRGLRYLERLHIEDPPAEVPVSTAHRLRAFGIDSRGDTTSVSVVSWEVADTVIATVDARGTLHPRSIGTTTVYASAGGWRRDSTQIVVAPARHEIVFRENWHDDGHPMWRFFGTPSPTLTNGPEGVRSFWSRGDSSFTSGAYTTRHFAANRGLGVEIMLSAPVNGQWQGLTVRLAPVRDPDAMRVWDHRTGALPDQALNSSCDIAIPGGTSDSDRGGVVRAGPSRLTYDLPQHVFDGSWNRFVVQLFPDGTCGIGLNGEAIGRTEGGVSVDGSFQVILDSRSHGAVMLHGPLEVWEGVRGDMDWRQ